MFHPLVKLWFEKHIGSPTDIQNRSWPLIAGGGHALIAAPTGSGKTLTAFLWALNQLIAGRYPTGCTSVLYVSPLRALNNDIQKNLLQPLQELREVFSRQGHSFPSIRVKKRSADTDQADRRRILRHPPEILITTPESLNLMLSSPSGRSLFSALSTVILDEIHSLVNNKRGVHLITAVDRLVPLSGEFQRIALSATVKPLELTGRFVGGYRLSGDSKQPQFIPRPVSIVQSDSVKKYEISVDSPPLLNLEKTADSNWKPLVETFREIVKKNRSTLIFANSRSLVEKVTFKINEGERGPLAYAHHGSLSKEIRKEVEKRLKMGELKAIVATSSLELGIDIGALDEVILIQSPPSVSSAIQRIGRAGHRVERASRGRIFPIHSQDFIDAAVLTKSVMEHRIEEVRPVMCPLDVLAQIVTSMVGTEEWDLDALFCRIRTSFVYRDLRRGQFDLVVNMLAGRYSATRIRELKARVSVDRIDNTIKAKKGALLNLYLSGGTIPNRGNYRLVHQSTDARIGDLDEEFVWEARVGQVFTLGTQNWKIHRITHSDVFVLPAGPKTVAAPFWRAEGFNRDFHFSERIALFLEEADAQLADGEYVERLKRNHFMDGVSAKRLIDFLQRQKQATGASLPHRHHLLVEFSKAGPDSSPGNQAILHTMWGGRVNRPFALALDGAWQERYGYRLEIFAENGCIVFLLPHPVTAEEILSLVASDRVEEHLKKRLEGSGFFCARFRECAGRALLLSKRKFNERMPLWMNRMQSQKLMDSIASYDDFPILLETWRTCLQDEFDLNSLRRVLREVEQGTIGWSKVVTSTPSPMGRSVAFQQIGKYMYMEDAQPGDASSRLNVDLLNEIVLHPGSRPAIGRELVRRYEEKRQRIHPGYSPADARDLLDWTKERVLFPSYEWEGLIRAIKRDHEIDFCELTAPVSDKILRVSGKGESVAAVVAKERISDYLLMSGRSAEGIAAKDLKDNPVEISVLRESHPNLFPSQADNRERKAELFSEWLSFYGPIGLQTISKKLGFPQKAVRNVLDELISSKRAIAEKLIDGGERSYYCDSRCFETLLRMARAEAVPDFETLEPERLQQFLADFHGIGIPDGDVDRLYRSLERLNCYRASAETWESDIIPARVHDYKTAWLDEIVQQSDLIWKGNGGKRVLFHFETDSDLLISKEEPDETDGESISQGSSLFPEIHAKYDFATLLRLTKLSSSRLNERLWQEVWRGEVTNDSMAALRKGIENNFTVGAPSPPTRHNRATRRGGYGRSGFAKWKGSASFVGNWYRLEKSPPESNLLLDEERKKERARVLLDRYGIVFRELLQRELPGFRWSAVFKSLRLMELSGEITSGCFFHGIQGPQFVSHEALGLLRQNWSDDRVYWLNAADPVSLAGTSLQSKRQSYPKRVKRNYLVFRGKEIIATIAKGGKDLTFYLGDRDPNVQFCFQPLHHLLQRTFLPKRHITVENVNGKPAAESPYLKHLQTDFHTLVEFSKVTLYRKTI